jgi:putative ABC transport system ATP-binding protein
MSVLQTVNLRRSYGKGDTLVHALKNVSITINQGESVAIVGPSGSGKSTLLHLLGGLDSPTEGKVIADGKDLYALSERDRTLFRRRNFGFIFQSFNLIPVLTARENILMPLLLDGVKPEKKWFEELTDTLGISNRLNHLPGELSGGQQQRVAIARAVSARPRVVFADEPTGNLDTASSNEVLKLLGGMLGAIGGTLIIITHDMKIAEKTGRLIRIVDGQVANETGAA